MYPLAINVAESGLRAQNQVLETAAKNIANADVPGYKRQETRLSEVVNNGGVLGEVYTNSYPWVDKQMAFSSNELAQTSAVQESLDRYNSIISQGNVQQMYADFMDASARLGSFPESKQLQEDFNARGETLANGFKQFENALSELNQTTKNKIDLNQMQLDSLKNQLTQISSRGINQSNQGDVQFIQQQIATITGTISGYNEFINNISPPLTYKFNEAIDSVKKQTNEAATAPVFASDGRWAGGSSPDALAIANSEKLSQFKENFGAAQTAAGVATNTALLNTKFYTNQFDAASKDWNAAYGVNLERETVKIINAQRMYEANAKVIRAGDSMIGSLLNAIG